MRLYSTNALYLGKCDLSPVKYETKGILPIIDAVIAYEENKLHM